MAHRHIIWKLALALILVLNTASLTALASSRVEGDSGILVTEDGTAWKDKERLDIFGTAGDAKERLLAPGSNGTYEFKVKNTAEEVLEFQLDLQEENLHDIPLEIRLKAEEQYICGSEERWERPDEVESCLYAAEPGEEISFVMEWRWLAGAGRSESNTQLGKKAVQEDLHYQLSMEIRSEQALADPGGEMEETEETEAPGKVKKDSGKVEKSKRGTAVKTADASGIWHYAFLMVAMAAVVLGLYSRKKNMHVLKKLILFCLIFLGMAGIAAGTVNARFKASFNGESGARAAQFQVDVVSDDVTSYEEETIHLYSTKGSRVLKFRITNNGEVTADCRIEAISDIPADIDQDNFTLGVDEYRDIEVTVYADANAITETSYDLDLHIWSEQKD